MADLRRRSQQRQPSADEQPDAMIAEAKAKQPQRAKSLEPSMKLTPALKRTSGTPSQAATGGGQATSSSAPTARQHYVPPLPGASLLPLPAPGQAAPGLATGWSTSWQDWATYNLGYDIGIPIPMSSCMQATAAKETTTPSGGQFP